MSVARNDGCQPRLTFVGHATVLIEVAGLRILTDPVLTDRVAFIRRVVPSVPTATATNIDLVLVSHLHHDHLHVPSLRQISPGTPIVVPRGATPAIRRGHFDDIVEVVVGEQVRIGAATITAVPALHSDQRLPIGRRAQPLGYLIEADGWTCYFAGDTDVFNEMESLAGHVDVALLPVWGWGPTLGHGHLDPHRAAEAVHVIEPRSVVPIHWGTLWPIGLGRYRRDRLVSPPLELVDSLSRFDVATDVRLLQPGTSARFASPRRTRVPSGKEGLLACRGNAGS